MADNPMGSGGVEIDMVDGQPIMPDERIEKARKAKDDALIQAAAVAQELRNNPEMIQALADEYMSQLDFMASENPVCQSIARIFKKYNNTLDIIPQLRHQKFVRMAGPAYQIAVMAEGEGAP